MNAGLVFFEYGGQPSKGVRNDHLVPPESAALG
jgi:hypothetical protein